MRLERLVPMAVSGLSILFFLGLWQWGSTLVSPLFLPSPEATFQTASNLLAKATLVAGIQASLTRILIGFVIGALAGVALGQAIGNAPFLNAIVGPFVSIFRFIPTIAVLPLALLWLGPNEPSKIFLVAYSTVFIVTLGTTAAVMNVAIPPQRAARSLGASELQVFLRVIFPSSIPGMVSSSLVALGFAFMVIVTAEMVGSRSGLGYLISQGRQLQATGQIFVGIIVLGIAGFILDRLATRASRVFLGRYGVKA